MLKRYIEEDKSNIFDVGYWISLSVYPEENYILGLFTPTLPEPEYKLKVVNRRE